MSASTLAFAPPVTRRPLGTVLGVALLLCAAITFIVVDPLLAWDDANEILGRGRLFLYYTAQSNLIAAGVAAWFGIALLRGRAPGRVAEYVRGLAVVDMAITGLVNGALLADPSMPWTFSEFVLHQIGPVLMVAWWIAMPPERPLPFAAVALWLVHPVLWTASAFTYAAESTDHWYPYFFLDPALVDGWGGVAMFVALIHLAIAVLGALAVLASRARWRSAVWSRVLA